MVRYRIRGHVSPAAFAAAIFGKTPFLSGEGLQGRGEREGRNGYANTRNAYVLEGTARCGNAACHLGRKDQGTK